ncbi:MAG: hypothetical protein MJ104_02265 [Lachnospiraceae bacterium]|nr:hypothetical protein [Lachnospiraceae bacterium]
MSKRNHKKKNIAASNAKAEMDAVNTQVQNTETQDTETQDAETAEVQEEAVEAEFSESAEEATEAVSKDTEAAETAGKETETVNESATEATDEGTVSVGEVDFSDDNPEVSADTETNSDKTDSEEADSDADETDTDVKDDANDDEIDSAESDKKDEKKANLKQAAEADVRKEAARVAKDKHERKKSDASASVQDEKREARRKRRIRNQVLSYIVIILLVAILVGIGVFAYLKFIKPISNTETTENVIEVSEATEQTEDIINDMLGMEDDISEPVVEPVDDVVEPEPEPDLLGEYVAGIIADMSLEDKVAGIFMVTPESITGATVATIAGDATQRALDKYAVGGIVYSDKNISNKDQFTTLIEKTSAMVKYPTFFAFSEEGGDMGALAKAGYYEAEQSASDIAATDDVTNAYSAGVSIGFAMNEIGLNVNLAPVADLAIVTDNILGGRIYSDNSGQVLTYANEMMRGLEDGNVTACVKYFPGVGMITENPEAGRVVSERTDEEFSSAEFLIYQNLIENGANMIMISNVVYSAYCDVPASLSEDVVTGILRNRLGYNGIVISGNLSDMAVSQYYGSDEAAIAALKAGCDILFCPEDFETAYEGIIQAVNDGVIDEKRIDNALERILRVKYAEAYEQ